MSTETKALANSTELRMLMHYYVESEQWKIMSSAEDKARSALINKGLLGRRIDEAELSLTDRGAATVRLILSTPLPVAKAKWFDPRTDEAIYNELA